MLFVRHLGRVLRDLFAYSAVTRRVGLLLVVVVGLALVALALVGNAAAPFVLYPFV